jgi:hypothetical protein
MTAIARDLPAAPDIVIFAYGGARWEALVGIGSIGRVRHCIVVVFDLLGLRFPGLWCVYMYARSRTESG